MVETSIPPPSPPQVDLPIHIGAPGGVPHVNLHPPVVEIDNQPDAFFSPRVAYQYDAFGPTTNEVEKKVNAIEDKLRAMESTYTLGLDATKMFLVPGVLILAKFKVLDFEKYKGNSDPRTHIKAYCQNIDAYSGDDRLLMKFF